MKLYTKTGDKGKTSLVGGSRVGKNDPRLEAYGTIDELNAHIGMLIAFTPPRPHIDFLLNIQHTLFSVGANIATDTTRIEKQVASIVSNEQIAEVEQEIDNIDKHLSPLTSFVLPSGSKLSALCHICRTVTRRAERRIIEVDTDKNIQIDENIIIYVNRLSDYFFALARLMLKHERKKEILWKPLK